VAFTKLCYDQSPPLFFRMDRGHCELRSREGTQQGDPLGCLYMALPLHEVLTDLHRDHLGVVIIAYVDDIVILAPPELVRLAYLDLVEMLWTRLGLSASRGSAMFTPQRGMCPLSPRPWQVQMAVVKALWSLGCPLALTSLFCRRSDGGCGSWGWWCPSYTFSETRRCSIFSCGVAPTRVCPTSFEGFLPTLHDPERCSTTPPSWKGCRTSFQAPCCPRGPFVWRGCPSVWVG
jgi:hypothetical protein